LNTFKGDRMTEQHWRPQVLWLPMGGLLGAFSGALVGIVYAAMFLAADDPFSGDTGPAGFVVAAVGLGAWFGGIVGLAVGCFVGVELMFLVGAHLSRDTARRRAYALGFLLPPLTMLGMVQVVALVNGTGALPLADVGWSWVLLAGGSLMGGPLARWLAGWQPPRMPVS
jgi:hypothetical protein